MVLLARHFCFFTSQK